MSLSPTDYLSIGAIVLSTLLMAVAATMESALASISRVRLRELERSNPQAVDALNDLIESPRSFVTAAELTEALTLMLDALLIERLVSRLPDLTSKLITLLLALLIVLLLGIVLPRTRAGYEPELTAMRYLRWLEVLRAITRPLLFPLLAISRLILRLLGRRPAPASSSIQEEVLALVSTSEEDEPNGEEEEMLESLVEFRSTLVREVMVPRPDIVAVPLDATLAQVLDQTLEAGYSRLPVYNETIDEVRGVLHVKDLLKVLRDQPPASSFDVRNLMRPVNFVPEAKKVDELLKELRTRRSQLAIVVDEYVGTAGLVTIEDLLEEIVGEIQDEYDVEEPNIQRDEQDPDTYLIDARASLDEVDDELGVNWQDEEYDTVGGLVFNRLGRIPVIGDAVAEDNYYIVVKSTEGRRLRKLQVTRLPGPVALSELTGNDEPGSSGRSSRGNSASTGNTGIDQGLEHNLEES